MNILRILTLNKHSDFQEVMFSSLLSYLLNPANDHGLGSILLEKLVREVFDEKEDGSLQKAIVRSEYPLGDKGKVDIYIEWGADVKKALAIEVKICDRSAKNRNKSGTPQVVRYCNYLWEKHKDDGVDWRFVYLVPSFDSPQCRQEFDLVCANEYRDRLRLMAWTAPDEECSAPPAGRVKPVEDMVFEIIDDKEFRLKTPLNTQWLLDSLQGMMPDIKPRVPEVAVFPVAADLRKNQGTWRIFDVLFSAARRWPSGQNSTVGVPYGTGSNRSTVHDNSLYRIRTTRAYYNQERDKDKNLPTDKVELELWEDAYALVEEEFIDWLRRKNIDASEAIKPGKHLDNKDNLDVKVLGIDSSVSLSETDISDFNSIMRIGFDRVRRKSAE